MGGLIVLTELSVRNLALLEDARLEFAPGFLVLTGETGAGKSILLDALGLALGRRADPGQIRQGADRLSVAVRFRLSGQRLSALLKELGLEGDDDALVLRREVDAGGKSRAFVNDHPVSAATLARLGERLVFIHGQNEHQLLLKASEQRDAVDDLRFPGGRTRGRGRGPWRVARRRRRTGRPGAFGAGAVPAAGSLPVSKTGVGPGRSPAGGRSGVGGPVAAIEKRRALARGGPRGPRGLDRPGIIGGGSVEARPARCGNPARSRGAAGGRGGSLGGRVDPPGRGVPPPRGLRRRIGIGPGETRRPPGAARCAREA
ncbi:MAG: AAA family ATPase [Elusimicrobia bacterium]|nr:AAA family ATPase [Elusimicrobiota bacterium]